MPIIAGQFPSVVERERINTLQKYQKLYENKSQDVLGLHEIIKKQYKQVSDLVYLAHAIPARVSDFYGDFVQGDVDTMLIEVLNGSEEEEKLAEEMVVQNDIKEEIYDWGVDQSQFGYFVLLGSVDEKGKFIIEEMNKSVSNLVGALYGRSIYEQQTKVGSH